MPLQQRVSKPCVRRLVNIELGISECRIDIGSAEDYDDYEDNSFSTRLGTNEVPQRDQNWNYSQPSRVQRDREGSTIKYALHYTVDVFRRGTLQFLNRVAAIACLSQLRSSRFVKTPRETQSVINT